MFDMNSEAITTILDKPRNKLADGLQYNPLPSYITPPVNLSRVARPNIRRHFFYRQATATDNLTAKKAYADTLYVRTPLSINDT